MDLARVAIEIASFINRRLPAKPRAVLGPSLATRLTTVGTARREIQGALFDFDLGDWTQRLYFLGGPDDERLAYVRSVLDPEAVIVDVGAAIGLYTVVLGRHVGESGRVIAFEPLPDNARLLRRNIELNGLRNVAVYPFGLSDEDGRASFYVPTGTVGPTAWARVGATDRRFDKAGDFTVKRLDTILVTERLDFMKIDVEGHEARVLAGARRCLERFRPLILCEIHPSNQHSVFQIIAPLGYRAEEVSRIVGGVRSPMDFFLLPS